MFTSTPSTSNHTITITPKEEGIIHLLVGCAHWIDDNPNEVDLLAVLDPTGMRVGKLRGSEKVQLRIAGGWVRDKLLGADSDDIDISIYPDPLTGGKFAKLLQKYLIVQEQQVRMGTLTELEAKPDQSKHLETATAVVDGLSIDFVHQRGKESYTDDSRIPVVSFGTPLEDALRRDLTINALFYNLQSRQIEDITGKGLQDLGLVSGHQPTIRTPLDPFITFKEDPLRVIRAVRFAARFGFVIDDELEKAVRKEEIRSALKDGKKIARDRVGVELAKMLAGRFPCRAMEIIHRLDLHPLIFLYDPTKASLAPDFVSLFPPPTMSTSSDPVLSHPEPDLNLSLRASSVIDQLLTSPLLSELHPLLRLSTIPTTSFATLAHVQSETIKRLYTSAALLPLYPLTTLEKKKKIWLGEKVVAEGLKWKTSDKVFAGKARDGSDLLRSCVAKYGSGVEDEVDRLEIGLTLRNKLTHDELCGAQWNVSLFWSLVLEIVSLENNASQGRSQLIQRYNRFIERILEFQLETRAFAPPILNGNDILDIIDELKAPHSPDMSLSQSTTASLSLDPSSSVPPSQPKRKSTQAVARITEIVIQWQLTNPSEGKEECRDWLKREQRGRVEEWIKEYEPKVGVKRKVEV